MSEHPSILSLFQLTDEQKAAATSLEGAISVQAGAGSGKTRALVGRFLALLESGLPLRSLVAITFTDKAAREMRNRIRSVTSEWLAQKDLVADQAMWSEVFTALDSARISTIHGLCATILRAHPAEAGVDPVFGLLEEGQSAVWQSRAVEAALVEAANDVELVQLFQIYQEGQIRRMLGELLARRLDVEPMLAELSAPAEQLQRWSDAITQWFDDQVMVDDFQAAIDVLASAQSTVPEDKLEVARRNVLSHWQNALTAKERSDWDACFSSLATMRKGTAARGGQKGNWDADDLAAVREAMQIVRGHYEKTAGQLIPAKKELRWALDQQAATHLTLARNLFYRAQAIYRNYKDEADVLDFDDLEQMTARLLRGNPAIRRRWQEEISAVLLVDEFQDTNERQREIVYALVGFRESVSPINASNPQTTSGSATGHQPTSLFVVGDAKQSIYRFRGADVAVFRQVQDDIRAVGGALIDFNLTFRAHEGLLELTNELLAPIMSSEERPERPYDVPFSPLVAFRQRPREGMAPPFLSFEIGLGADKAKGRRAAANALVEQLTMMQNDGILEWRDVVLLFRSSTAYGFYEDALERAGIPYVTVAGRGFYQRPEIRDLLNVLAAVADPTDDLAMAGFLRSPAIGCSDAMIHRLRWGQDDTRRSFISALRDHSSTKELAESQEQEAVGFALALLDDLSGLAGRVTVAHLLKTFLDRTHYRSILRLAPGGERLRRNVDKLLDAAHRSQLVSISEFLEYVAVLRDVGARESEAPTEAGGAVQLMTIHKSKGLEFPVVVLADAGYSRMSRTAPFYLDQKLGLVFNPPDEDAVAISYRLAAWHESEQEAAEARRLLYVAATRAMEKLIVSGDARLSTAKASPGKLMMGGWLQSLAEVVGFAGITVDNDLDDTVEIPLEWGSGGAACRLWAEDSSEPSHPAEIQSDQRNIDIGTAPLLLDSPASASPVHRKRRLPTRNSEGSIQPWQVVTESQSVSDSADEWLVSYLTHTAVRYWRLPDLGNGDVGDGQLTQSLRDFWRPFALEAGLSNAARRERSMVIANELLCQLCQSSFYQEIQEAERHHHVSYSFMDMLDGRVENVSGVVDLVYRHGAGPFTVAELITDPLPTKTDLKHYVKRVKYDYLFTKIGQVVAAQVGEQPRVKLVFLSKGGVREVVIADYV